MSGLVTRMSLSKRRKSAFRRSSSTRPSVSRRRDIDFDSGRVTPPSVLDTKHVLAAAPARPAAAAEPEGVSLVDDDDRFWESAVSAGIKGSESFFDGSGVPAAVDVDAAPPRAVEATPPTPPKQRKPTLFGVVFCVCNAEDEYDDAETRTPAQ